VNENRKSSSIRQFSAIDLNNNNNNVATCKTCDYKLLCSNNSKTISTSIIQHYPVLIVVPVLARYLI